MKKRLLAAAVAAALTLSVGTALAAPVATDSELAVQYRYNTYNNATQDKVDGYKYTYKLNAKTELDKNFSIYARLAGQGASTLYGGSAFGADFNSSAYNAGSQEVFGIDEFGVDYANAGFQYKIGRQAPTIGTGLLYDKSFYLGKRMLVDGINATGKSGVTNLQVFVGAEDKSGSNDNKLYAVHGSYSPAENWTLGATLAKYDGAADTNHWAIDASYVSGKAVLFGEYAKSDADTANKAYDLGLSYAFDKKNSAYAIYNYVQANGDMGGWTTFENNEKGMYYGVDHKLNKATTLSLFFKDKKNFTDSTADNTSFRTTVTVKF